MLLTGAFAPDSLRPTDCREISIVGLRAVAKAFLHGATRCLHPEKLSCVASVFVSRMDTIIHGDLEATVLWRYLHRNLLPADISRSHCEARESKSEALDA